HAVAVKAVEILPELRLAGFQVAHGPNHDRVFGQDVENPLVVLQPGAGLHLDSPDHSQRRRDLPVAVGQGSLVEDRIVLRRPGHALRARGVEQVDVRVDDRKRRGFCSSIGQRGAGRSLEEGSAIHAGIVSPPASYERLIRMPEKVRWGILSTAKIGTAKVIPAMQRGEWSEVVAIASRNPETARSAAAALGIARSYGSYEELLADPGVEAIYNPLPNDMHVPWSIRAAEAGKHVLCEKPLALSVAESRELIAARDRTRVRIGEAFMVRTHPQWLRAREIVRSGEIGDLRSIMFSFSFSNRDPKN